MTQSTQHSRPHIIGLTGSIGMGKSTVADMFRDNGVPVFDADAAVHILQGPGGELVSAIEAEFPGTTIGEGSDAYVDRQKLGAAVLGDKDKLARLEALMHPAVGEMRAQFFADNADVPMVVFDIPLLFEKGGADYVDTIVTVSAPGDVQRERVLARPGMSEEKFAHILGLQTPDAEKRARSDHVVDTGVTLEETAAAVKQLVDQIGQKLAQNADQSDI
ncbi:dephospho-CoA kinase [Alterisphingorhabdus coralli]|uniref:Dephospho-CoA kinase n=1 Tax=Alterisphingorhabdus coralli TaxID=3071408 RepID=A0AA97F8X1_9SPHN|nr:dephospho-CoA kinase [Parasphingorhabdus sp. SCSIO 66989]WOE75458.1 dephospho-CoA kinase [Parasphingorhabdus sp. SCSIO 66989]